MWSHESLFEPVWQRLALALLHFLWQGALIAAAHNLLVQAFLRRPHQRYAAGVLALCIMAACPLVTYVVVEPPMTGRSTIHGEPSAAATDPYNTAHRLAASADYPKSDPKARADLAEAADRAPVTTTEAAPSDGTSPIERAADWRVDLYRWIAVVWLFGVSVCSLRLLAGAIGLRSITGRTSPALDEQVRLLERLGHSMGLRRVPRLAVSERLTQAIATGLVRPMIVLPAAWLAELPPAVVEAVLAHELAHIRRHDLLVNLLQRTIEALLFFHPAVWWLSRQIRSDREMCCDELAVAATRRKVAYVSALEIVARRAAREPRFSLATGIGGRKMQLLARVRHVLGLPTRQRPGGWWGAGILALAVPLGMWAFSGPAAPLALGQDDRDEERERDERGVRREREERQRAQREDRRARERAEQERARERRRDEDRELRERERRESREARERDEREGRDRGERADDRGRSEEREFNVELDKQRRAAEEQRRRAEEHERDARGRQQKQQQQQQQMRRELERARDELKRHMSEAQEKIAAAMKQAEASGQKDQVEALRRKMEELHRQAEEQARGIEEKMAKAMQKMQDKGPKVGFSFADPSADEMRHAVHELGEQLGHLQEKLQVAHKEGDKAAIEKLHAVMEKMKAEEAMMREKFAQSFGEKVDKGLIAKKQAIREREGAGGSPEAQREMMQMIKELRGEVQELRREVRELRDQGGRADKTEKPRPKKEKVSTLEEIPYVGKLFKNKTAEDFDPQPKASIEFTDPKVDKRWQETGKLKLELDKLQKEDVEKLKAVEIELNNAPAEKVNEQAIKRLAEQAANDIDIRYATKAAEVAKTELEKLLEANRKTPGAVGDTEIRRRQASRDLAVLEIERAKRDQLDRLSKLKAEIQDLDKYSNDPVVKRALETHQAITRELFESKDADKVKVQDDKKEGTESNDQPPESAKP